jgi:hypothetical protein
MRKYQVLSSLVIFAVGFALSAIVDSRRLASLAQGTQSNSLAPAVAEQSTRQPAALQKWEYRVIIQNAKPGSILFDVEQQLNQLGEQGYEVCGVGQSQSIRDSGASATEYNVTIVLRRPK